MKKALSSFFKLSSHGTNIRTETLAGLTTFLTLSYIVFVNPLILRESGMDPQAVITATILGAAFATLVMGIVANQPFALAPGMGLNAYFTYSIVLGLGIPWQTALGAVFISGVVFIILTATKLRIYIVNAVPLNLKHAIGAGIGFFLTFIGLKNAKFIAPHDVTYLTIGDFASPEAFVATAGILITIALLAKKVKGALLLGILSSTILAAWLGITHFPSQPFSYPPSLAPLWLQLDIKGALQLGFFTIIFSFLIVDFFDTMGTIIALGKKAGLMDKKGHLHKMNHALMSDAIGTTAGACLGTSTVTTYIESAAGIQEGGRTGLTAVVCALLLLLLLFCAPIIVIIPGAATAPALIVVGLMMVSSIKDIDLEDYTNAFPAFLTVIMIPFSFSIARGIACGFISYTLIKTITGRWRDVHPMMYFLSFALGLHLAL